MLIIFVVFVILVKVTLVKVFYILYCSIILYSYNLMLLLLFDTI